MADSILRLKVESQEYDQKIKRAAEGIQHFVKNLRDSGSSLQENAILARGFLMQLGQMETVASGGKAQLREMSNALVTLTQTYRDLSDAEKSSGFGQELNRQIQILTERAGAAKDAMMDVEASIKNAASDTRTFDQVAGGVSLMTAGFQTATGAAEMLGIELGNSKDVLTTLAAAMSVTNGLQTIQNALQKQSAVMMGVQAVQTAAAAAAQTTYASATGAATIAQKALNAVANANPYVLLATAVAAVGSALIAFSSASSKSKKEAEELAKAEEEAKKKADEQRQAFVNASAESMNTASRISNLQVAYKQANSEMEKTSILRQAQQEFKKLGIECNGLNDAQTLLIKQGGKIVEMLQLQGNVAALSAIRMEKYKESFRKILENNGDVNYAASLAGSNKDVVELDKQINAMQGRIQGIRGSLPTTSGTSGRTGRSSTKQEDTNYAPDSIMAQEKEVQKLTDAWNRASASMRDGILKDLDAAKAKLDEMKNGVKPIEGGSLGEFVVRGDKMKSVDKSFSEAPINFDSINTYISGVKDSLKNADLGTPLYESLTEKLSDASTMTAVLQQAMASGVSAADMTSIADELKRKLLEGDISEEAWQEMLDKINEKITDSDLKLTFNVDTQSIETAAEKQKKEAAAMAKDWQSAGNAIQAVGQAMNAIEDPATKVLATIAQAVASIALGASNAIANYKTFTGWDWIAFAAAATATMISTIASVHNATGYADGGIVKGNTYSGDQIPAMLNAGEVVLNAAQTSNVAHTLEGNGMQNLSLSTEISGEDIRIALNNNGRRTGRGEFVQTNRRQ